ncbi:MAG: hypothetical protein CM15mP21_0820 [Hyphomicrobiales bacterium]|nr:MAG: hypothetical protein CM15mP21_0820 [Hyphomicrobiales bacterium]
MLKSTERRSCPPLFKACVTTQTPDLAEAFFDNAGAVAQAIGLPKSGGTRIEAYFTEAPEFGDLPFAHEDFDLEHVPDEDWVSKPAKSAARASAAVFLFGHHDRPHARRARHHIEMDAGLAFGSGHHETTQGCLHLLAHVLKNAARPRSPISARAPAYSQLRLPRRGADMFLPATMTRRGAGGAAKFQNQYPARAYQADMVQRTCPSCGASGRPFDLIMANILAAPLITMASTMTAHLAPAGRLSSRDC